MSVIDLTANRRRRPPAQVIDLTANRSRRPPPPQVIDLTANGDGRSSMSVMMSNSGSSGRSSMSVMSDRRSNSARSMSNNNKSRFPAADWLRKRLRGRPYVLHHAGKVPGLHPSSEDADIAVVYDKSSAKRFDGSVVDVIKAVVQVAATRCAVLGDRCSVLVALEHASKDILEYFQHDMNIMEIFVGKWVDSRRALKKTWYFRFFERELGMGITPALARNMIRQFEQAPLGYGAEPARDVQRFLEDMRASYRRYMNVHSANPKRRKLEAYVSSLWPTEAYKGIQSVKRAPDREEAEEGDPWGARNGRALNAYMRRYAVRAPNMPPKVRNLRTGSEAPYLCRGATLSSADLVDLIVTRRWEDRGFMAFTRDIEYAVSFGGRFWKPGDKVVVFRIRTSEVPRGTPWVWFVGMPEAFRAVPALAATKPLYPFPQTPAEKRVTGLLTYKTFRPPGFLPGEFEPENEVLLPPGSLVVTRYTKVSTPYNFREYHLFDCVYAPDPSYTSPGARRGRP